MATATGSKRLFISYRRSDTDALAGRIKDRLHDQLPDWNVFMDVASIEAGAAFKQVIDTTLAQSSVLVSLIGRNWLSGSRIHEPGDLVRYEIATALSNHTRIIPVLVNDAKMPSVGELPADIAALAELNGIELRHTRFDDDFQNLIKAVAGRNYRARKTFADPIFAIARRVVWGALLGAVVALVGLAVHFQVTGKSASERTKTRSRSLFYPRHSLVVYSDMGGRDGENNDACWPTSGASHPAHPNFEPMRRPGHTIGCALWLA